MDELRNEILGHLAGINSRKDQIREALNRSRSVYAAYEKRRRRRQALSGISLLVVGTAACLAGLFVIPSLVKTDAETLFMRHYERYPFEIAVRSGEPADPLSRAAMWYATGQPEKTLDCLDSLVVNQQDTERTWLLKGLAELDRGLTREADSSFIRVVASGGITGQTALWYQSLGWVREGRYREATRQLRELKRNRTDAYHREATELLRRIRFRKNP